MDGKGIRRVDRCEDARTLEKENMRDALEELTSRRGSYASAGQANDSFWEPALRGSASSESLSLRRSAEWVFEAAKKLEALGRLQKGWDSYGGSGLKPAAKHFTVCVLGWLDQEELPTPAVVLGSGGTIQLEWRSRGRELDLDLGEGEGVVFVKVDPQGNIAEGHASNLPEDLQTLTRWLIHG
jgi:hypothetical protein